MEAESKGGCVVKLIGFKDSRDAPIRLHDSFNAHCGQGTRTIALHDTAIIFSAYRLSFADSRRMMICRPASKELSILDLCMKRGWEEWHVH
jgi:hypothetical protein